MHILPRTRSSARSIAFGAVFLVMGLILTQPSLAQEEPSDKADSTEVAALLKKISDHMDANEWTEVSELMTEEAWKEWSASLVVECLSVAKMDSEVGFPFDGMEEAQEAITEALEKHDLDEIEIEMPTIEVRMDEDIEIDDEDTEMVEAQTERIQEVLGSDKNRMEIVQALWAARKGSPFGVNLFGGTIENEETVEDVIHAKVSPAFDMPEEQDGVVMKIVVPPVVINVKKADGNWKYAGINDEKTAEAMKNFRPMAGEDFREDF